MDFFLNTFLNTTIGSIQPAVANLDIDVAKKPMPTIKGIKFDEYSDKSNPYSYRTFSITLPLVFFRFIIPQKNKNRNTF